MNVATKKLPAGKIELTVTVFPDEQQPHLIKTAEKLSETNKISGFRPGHAPYDVVAAQFGEMKIMDSAMESIVRATFVQAIKDHNLKTVGMPDITIDKSAPKNEIIYRATVSLLPTVNLPKLESIMIDEKIDPVADAELEEVLKDLRRMHAKEILKVGIAGEHDKVTVDMDLLDGHVPLEGGQAKNHSVYLDESYYIPGFTEKLLGCSAGQELEFVLAFPTEHYQKIFAGKNITFKVRVVKIESRKLPEINDEFAKLLGVESVDVLKKNIRENIGHEHKRRAHESAEIELLKKLTAAAVFGELPDVLLDAERRKMMFELKDKLEQSGISVEQYLSDLKKTPEEIQAGFTDQATERLKAALITHEIAEHEKIVISKDELQEEIEAIREAYKNNPDAVKRLIDPKVQESIMTSIQNRKVMEWLHEKCIKHAE